MNGVQTQNKQLLELAMKTCEPKNGGHMTITHQMLASAFQAFRTRSLVRSEKKNIVRIHVQYFPDLFPYFIIL